MDCYVTKESLVSVFALAYSSKLTVATRCRLTELAMFESVINTAKTIKKLQLLN